MLLIEEMKMGKQRDDKVTIEINFRPWLVMIFSSQDWGLYCPVNVDNVDALIMGFTVACICNEDSGA